MHPNYTFLFKLSENRSGEKRQRATQIQSNLLTQLQEGSSNYHHQQYRPPLPLLPPPTVDQHYLQQLAMMNASTKFSDNYDVKEELGK